jgi:hypothetical protein
MTEKFTENESYAHKLAKGVLKEWFDEGNFDDVSIGDISFRPNRKSGVFLEYPICKNIHYTIKEYDEETNLFEETSRMINGNSWMTNWDEIEGGWSEYVPTYDECLALYNSCPVAIIDIVCSHKGRPLIGIEICHKNPVSREKINKLKDCGVDNLIEIDSGWILSQTKRPLQLKYKKLI